MLLLVVNGSLTWTIIISATLVSSVSSLRWVTTWSGLRWRRRRRLRSVFRGTRSRPLVDRLWVVDRLWLILRLVLWLILWLVLGLILWLVLWIVVLLLMLAEKFGHQLLLVTSGGRVLDQEDNEQARDEEDG